MNAPDVLGACDITVEDSVDSLGDGNTTDSVSN